MEGAFLRFLIFVCGFTSSRSSNLFPYWNQEVGVIPVSVGKGTEGPVIRIWEGIPEEKRVDKRCLLVGKGISCGNSTCERFWGRKFEEGVHVECDFEEFRPRESEIPTFIDKELPASRVFDLRSAPGIGKDPKGVFGPLRVCYCLGRDSSEGLILSPPTSSDFGGWRLEIFPDGLEVPRLYPFNRFIVDVRVLLNPGWNLEFGLKSSLSAKIASFSVASLKKDSLCQGFPEEEALKVLQPTGSASGNGLLLQSFSWNPNNDLEGQKFDYKFPVNHLSTAHYYICFYHHHNSRSGHNIGSVYFRLSSEDGIRAFSLLLLILIFTPLIMLSLYIVIGSKHKTSIEKLQGYILFENRSQRSSMDCLATALFSGTLVFYSGCSWELLRFTTKLSLSKQIHSTYSMFHQIDW
ncbi:hypothetical protein HWI79_1612 [Cryptosporidium felis]|nr:hypothetical protein HWI79_1612 [Cryptosporidium felis]